MTRFLTFIPCESRSLSGHETYAVVLNLESTSISIDLTELTKDFGKRVVVVAAGAKSSFNVG